MKIGGVTKKGYRSEDLHEPWSRYPPPEPRGGSATSATSATAQVSEEGEVAGSGQQTLPLPATPL